jgi:hypothetical protein
LDRRWPQPLLHKRGWHVRNRITTWLTVSNDCDLLPLSWLVNQAV